MSKEETSLTSDDAHPKSHTDCTFLSILQTCSSTDGTPTQWDYSFCLSVCSLKIPA